MSSRNPPGANHPGERKRKGNGMSAFLHEYAHIDVCVDAVLSSTHVFDTETDKYADQLDPTALGRRLLAANLDSVIARYGPPDSASSPGGARYYPDFLDYRHRRNEAVAALWAPRRLSTYHLAVSSLDYQACEPTGWSSSPTADLLEGVLVSLAAQLRDIFAVPGAWAWSGYERGGLPEQVKVKAQEWTSLPIEVVTTAAGETPSVFVDGQPVSASVLAVDAGAGWEWRQWCEFRDATVAAASPAARAVLLDAFANPIGGEFVVGRGQASWLDAAPAASEEEIARPQRQAG